MIFSVIIPTFNRKELLISCLKNLSYQTYRDFEVIVSDDGSTDGSEAAVKDLQLNYPLKYIYIKNSGGPARPRNVAIRQAKGEWVCLLDSDDQWYNNKLEECLKFTHSCDFIYHDLIIKGINGNKKSLFKGRTVNTAQPVMDILCNYNPIATSSVCFRKTLFTTVGQFNESAQFRFIEDLEYWLRVVVRKFRLYHLAKRLGVYNVHGSNSSAVVVDQLKRLENIYSIYQAKFPSSKNRVMGAYYYMAGCAYERANNWNLARVFFKKAYLNVSWNKKAKAFLKWLIVKFKSW